jgi:hypothetical protein
MRLLPRLFFLRAIVSIFIFAAVGSTLSSQTLAQQPSQQTPIETEDENAIELKATWEKAVSALADKTAAAIKPSRTVSLEVKNKSSLDAESVASIRKAFAQQLVALHLKIEPDILGVRHIEVTLSESNSEYVWVAEVGLAESEQVVMVSVSKENNDVSNATNVTLTVQRNLLKTQNAPFLDFSKHDVSAGRVSLWTILEADELKNYGDVAPIPQIHVSRDPRGRLSVSEAGRVEAQVGGVRCASMAGGLIDCSNPDSSQNWVFAGGWESAYVLGRNYFAGLASDATGLSGKLPPFFSAVPLVLDHGTFWILTELDGKARFYESPANSAATFSGWGDDIATITTTCDPGWHVLVTGTGDWTQRDQIQVYDLKNHQALANGPPLEFPGPVLALWPSKDGKTVRAVSRNLQTGAYEASIISVSCGD